jgi:hypothetical protein
MKLIDYINQNFKSKAEFSRLMGVTPQQVTKWINEDWIFVDNKLYSFRRSVPHCDKGLNDG